MADTKRGTGQRSHQRQGYTVYWCLLVLLSTTAVLGEDQEFTFTVQEGESIALRNCTPPPPEAGDLYWSFKGPDDDNYTPQSCPQECNGGCMLPNQLVIDLPAVSRTCQGIYQYNTKRVNGIRWKCTYHLRVHYPPRKVYINNPTPAVFENDSLAMTCQTDDLGNPPARFTGPDFLAPSGSESSSLTILSAKREDNGRNFTCALEYEGRQQNGERVTAKYEDTASLTVYYLPREVTIRGHNNNTTLKVGEDVTLDCFFQDYNPRPNITWWKNGRKLPGETSTTLALQPLKVEDTGVYMCETTVNVLNQERSKKSTAVYVNVSSAANTNGDPPAPLPITSSGLPVYGIGTIAAGIVLLVVILIVSVICIRRRRNSAAGRRREEQRNGRHNRQNGGFQIGQDVVHTPLLSAGLTNVADQDFSQPSSNMSNSNGGRGHEIIIRCKDAEIRYQPACDAESLKTPSDPSMQVSSLSPSSHPYETSSSVEPRSDTTPKQTPSSDMFSTNEKLPYNDSSDKTENTASTDMAPTAAKVPYQMQDSSSDGYLKTGTSTEGGNYPPSSHISSDLEEGTNPKLTADDSDDLEDSSDPRSLHSHLSPPSLHESLDVGEMISLDSENPSRPTNSNPNLLDNGASNSTGVPMESNNLNIPITKPVPDKSTAIKNLSESSESMEESIQLEGSGGRDQLQEDPPPMNEVVKSLREKGDEVAITIDLMLKNTPLKQDHLGLSVSKLRDLYINLYSGANNWKIFAGELGLTSQNVQVIDSCSSQHHLKAAEIVIYHWQRMADRDGSVPCNEQKLRELLAEIERLDLISILDRDQ